MEPGSVRILRLSIRWFGASDANSAPKNTLQNITLATLMTITALGSADVFVTLIEGNCEQQRYDHHDRDTDRFHNGARKQVGNFFDSIRWFGIEHVTKMRTRPPADEHRHTVADCEKNDRRYPPSRSAKPMTNWRRNRGWRHRRVREISPLRAQSRGSAPAPRSLDPLSCPR